MEVRVRERLIGALVLVAIVVLVVPAILKGRGPAPAEPSGQPTRRVEVPVVGHEPAPEEQVLVPEPALPEAARPASDAPKPVPKPVVRETDTKPAPPKTAGTAPQAAATPLPATESATPKPAAAKPTPVPAVATAWAVQIGAFSNRAKAEQQVAELQKRRYAAFILEYRASGQVLYRVRVGPEQDRARAEEIAARLAKDGFHPVVARHP
ncbi:MAG TPA: SPOR domain-containing protein [Steroidobacteraceae bacterium]|jgi:DedD protein